MASLKAGVLIEEPGKESQARCILYVGGAV